MESQFVLDKVAANYEAKEPSPRKVLVDRMIYLSRNNFGLFKTSHGQPVLTDFDAAAFRGVSHPLTHLIQPDAYLAPEVTLGAPLVTQHRHLESGFNDKDLCDGFDPERQEYIVAAHFAQLIGFIGHRPQALLDRILFLNLAASHIVRID